MIDPFSPEYNFEKDVIKNIEKYLVKRFFYDPENIYSKQHDWLGTDDEKTFSIHFKHFPHILEYYVDNPIKYNINNHFCRSDFDFEKDKTLKVDIFLGCSHTFGMGLHEKHLWWNKVTEYTNNTPINLAVGGCSMEEQFIRLARVIDYFDVQNVIWFAPHFYRYTYNDGDLFRTFNINEYISTREGSAGDYPYEEWFIRHNFLEDDYSAYYNWKHATAVSGLCLQRDIPFFLKHMVRFDPEDLITREFNDNGVVTNVEQFDIDNNIPARDIIHMTVNQQTTIGNHMVELVKNNKEGYNPYNRELNVNFETLFDRGRLASLDYK